MFSTKVTVEGACNWPKCVDAFSLTSDLTIGYLAYV